MRARNRPRPTSSNPTVLPDGRHSCLTCFAIFRPHNRHHAFCSTRCNNRYKAARKTVKARVAADERARTDPVGHELHELLVGREREGDDFDAADHEQGVLHGAAVQARLRLAASLVKDE